MALYTKYFQHYYCECNCKCIFDGNIMIIIDFILHPLNRGNRITNRAIHAPEWRHTQKIFFMCIRIFSSVDLCTVWLTDWLIDCLLLLYTLQYFIAHTVNSLSVNDLSLGRKKSYICMGKCCDCMVFRYTTDFYLLAVRIFQSKLKCKTTPCVLKSVTYFLCTCT